MTPKGAKKGLGGGRGQGKKSFTLLVYKAQIYIQYIIDIIISVVLNFMMEKALGKNT